MNTAPSSPKATRDRAATERAILDAAKQVLVEQGFTCFGVNAIARAAGCDKQLIYRYYGGLDGLVDALGTELSHLFGEQLEFESSRPLENYGEFVEQMLLALLRTFRASDLLLRIAAWEILEPSPITRRLAETRGAALMHWVRSMRGDLEPPEEMDFGAINAILIAAVQHLVLSAHATGGFGGVPLDSDADWKRIEAGLVAMVRAIYPPSSLGGS
ncbi:TetR/AcrR family transcriptional regulator [Qipengyuania qiaonensis]|uniref:TetR/AcrR family transcriptional regulator n=1 Tax=Qipengyuania qiaonensis TaxID=2867240 RepID=A0ABS7J432_9SPHN|nr:TetR/AcrR family transcriptional regulator [Qipengyuania qiaonensis]MBX7481623.1 TetR/AcrR family transcriptional regulator [Qipengyuania qiaonensis]